MQEYRYGLLVGIGRFFELFGVRRPACFNPPVPAGDYDHALHIDHPEALSLLEQYLENNSRPSKLGGPPKEKAYSGPGKV